jgi:predicted RNase H-like HicB family nuclease
MNNAFTIHFNLPLEIKQDGDIVVASCPALDIVTQGDTIEHAKKNFVEAVELFLVTCVEMETLSEVIKDCGFKPLPGKVIKDSQYELIDVPLPFIAAQKISECHA